ncbi:hypothetical protein M0C34_16365 [Agarivorans sp. TSD2052]|uniref:hypothetical protein n=1 Tax=Agarivorans sp. TSD2052 TaxID=2937286 RepID=UPI0020106822|nr:hypothetical protein [Agarivorans sp. TSD2052]UPW17791.1 hypothetical protein M0C34_16365 [Agarivorans sp. TSD2052]
MKISSIRTEQHSGYSILRANCNGFDLWYKFPENVPLTNSADPFIAASLLISMANNQDIELESSAYYSPKLVENLEQLQRIFSHWQPYLGHRLYPVNIIGGTPCEQANTCNDTVSFFSGGIDGTYTYKQKQQEIDYLLFAKGIDMQLNSDALYQQAFACNKQYLAKQGKQLIPCETNVRFLGYKNKLNWGVCFGGGLSSIALALGVKKCFIAAGLTYQNNIPEGSNYITDRLWSNQHTHIIHHGANTRRIDKLKTLANDPDYLAILRVCWHDDGYNCGECEKCLRTMSSLRTLGIHTDTFPTLTDQMVKQKLSGLKLYNVHDLQFLDENIEQAKAINDTVMIKALEHIKRNFQLRELANQFDELILHGYAHKLKQMVIRH